MVPYSVSESSPTQIKEFTHSKALRRNGELTSHDWNRLSIVQLLRTKSDVPADLIKQLFITQRFFDKSIFEWASVSANWNNTNLPGQLRNKTQNAKTVFKSECGRWLKEINRNPWVRIKPSEYGLGLHHIKDVHMYELEQFLNDMTGDVWLTDIGKQYNSLTYVDIDLHDGTNMSGVAILYGLISFVNHRCNSSLRFAPHTAKSTSTKIATMWRRFKQPLEYVGKGKLPKDHIVFHGGDELLVSYKSGDPGFTCTCRAPRCWTKIHTKAE